MQRAREAAKGKWGVELGTLLALAPMAPPPDVTTGRFGGMEEKLRSNMCECQLELGWPLRDDRDECTQRGRRRRRRIRWWPA
jgi:hypothetical protein